MTTIHLSDQEARFIHAALIEACNKARSMESDHLDRHEELTSPESKAFHWTRYRAWLAVEDHAIELARLVEQQTGPMDLAAYKLPSCLPAEA